MAKPLKTHPASSGPRHRRTTAMSSSKSAKENIQTKTLPITKNPKATAVTRPKSTTAKHAKVSQPLQTPRAPSKGAKGADTAALLEKIASQEAVIDRLLKSQAIQPVKKTFEEIPRPAKITNLQRDMGLANDKKLYSQCRSVVRDTMTRAGLPLTDWRHQDFSAVAKVTEVARSKHEQLQRYTRNWATHEIMKTLIKNKRSYKKRIASADDERDTFMKDGEELEGDGNERRDEDEEENEEENGEEFDDGEENGEEFDDGEENGEESDDGEGNIEPEEGEEWDEDEEGDEEENGINFEGEGSGDDGEENTEEGENAEKEGSEGSFQRNGDEEVRDDVRDWAVGQRMARSLEREASAGFGATTSQSAAAKKSKISATTSKSVGRFKPAAVGLAGSKRKLPEDEDDFADQVAGRRNPARNIRESKKLRL